ncbi:TIGR02556 family CRISPR-associated protein [Caldanaerobius polysaccharolyticus]|uniref:TIGR02556 family CRISPR-associated protein n=1 Tax=Caldanaerobius polysaccharolyticus TaxID=44256 RepID=UPI00047D3B1A|nr:TIGR02556 family CRISPR-associated protein [Caldanaerobius polysaccharolyticus]
MLEAIKEIGEVILSQGGDEILSEMTVEIELSKSDKTKQHVVIIDINTDTMKASFDVEELKPDSVKKYLWVGNAVSNSLQWRITTDNIGYLCSQALPALCERLKESSLREKIKKIVEQGMTSFSDKVGKRYRYVWDLNKMGIEKGFDAIRLEEKISQKSPGGDIDEKLIKSVADCIEGYVRGRFNLDEKKDMISLYTLKIDGDLVCQDEGYVSLIYDEKINDIFKGVKQGVCSVCGRNVPVTADVRRFKHKYYNTDKPNFSSGVSGDFSKNFSLCPDCYKSILVTEVYMRNNLGSNIGSIPLYIIPGFLFKVDMDRRTLDEWAKYVNYNFNFVVSFEGMDKFVDGLREYLYYESEGNNYILNLLFYRKNQQEFKILKLIKDVPPSRIKEMIAASGATWEVGKKLLGNSKLWSIDLNKIYYLIPQRKKRNELLEVSKLLQVYDGIFSQKPVSKAFLIDKFVELAKIYRLKRFEGYNISAGVLYNTSHGYQTLDL